MEEINKIIRFQMKKCYLLVFDFIIWDPSDQIGAIAFKYPSLLLFNIKDQVSYDIFVYKQFPVKSQKFQ